MYFRWETKQILSISQAAIEHAKLKQYDLVIIDTAGRLHIDEKLMEELMDIKESVRPHEILLVVDSMTGQDALISETFNEKLGIDGVILTKLDGDTRVGGSIG